MRPFARLAFLSLFAGLGAPASAQDIFDVCNDGSTYGLQAQIAACTSVIQSGRTDGPKSLAAAYQRRGEARLRTKDEDGALADFSQSIALDPDNWRPWGLRGAIYRFRGDPNRALSDLNRALELDPSIAPNWALRADIYADLGDNARAASDYAEAHRLDSRFGNVEPSPAPAPAPVPTPVSAPGTSGNVWGSCIATEDPVQSGIQMIYAFRNNCTKTVTISFCMKATYEAAGDWNLCSQREYKTYDIRAGSRFEFPFTPVTPGDAMSDGRVVDRQEVSASGAACIGSSPSVYIENKTLVFQHC